MHDEELELPDCYEIKNEFIDKYINDKWYKNLSANTNYSMTWSNHTTRQI